jgi:hypothetical protein
MALQRALVEMFGRITNRLPEEKGAIGWLILGVLIGIILVIVVIVQLIIPGDGD